VRTVVFDSSALLAHFLGEPRGRAVRAMLDQARQRKLTLYMSAVNLAEVVYVLARRRRRDIVERLLGWLPQLRLTVVPADKEDAIAAALIKDQYGLTYGDSFAAALARRLHGELATTDPHFEKLEGTVPVVWI